MYATYHIHPSDLVGAEEVRWDKGGTVRAGNYMFCYGKGNKNRLETKSIHTVRKNAEALAVASKETGLEVNAEETKYMVMSRDQNAARSHNIKNDYSSNERVEEFKYLGTTLTYQNSSHEIKSRLTSGNACYHLEQNLLSSIGLSKNTKIKIQRTIILPVVLYMCATSLLTLRGGN